MPIYTKTGDKGKTSLFSGKRVAKCDVRVEAYGTIDELNTTLGVARAFTPENFGPDTKKLVTVIDRIQHTLFYLGSYLADLPDAIEDIDLAEETKSLEHEIDSMTEEMPVLSNFILPGGGKSASLLHVSRAVSRRAERQLVRLNQNDAVDTRVLQYLNRLSDALFTMARFANHIEHKQENIWQR